MTEAKKQKTGNSYRRRKSVRASRLTTALLSPALRRQGFVQTEIITRWHHIVGQDVADCVVPIKITFPRASRNGGTLLVRCESSFAPKLQLRIPMIIESVNSYYGYLAIVNVQIQQGPLPRKKARPSSKPLEASKGITRQVGSLVGQTKSEDLRRALQTLGEQMMAKDEKTKKK